MIADTLQENNQDIMKIINKLLKLKTGSKLFGTCLPPKVKQGKVAQNILLGIIKDIDTQSTDLKGVRESVQAAVKENSHPAIKLGPMTLPPVKPPFLPPLPEDVKNSTYTLVLDLDETLIHFFDVIELIQTT